MKYKGVKIPKCNGRPQLWSRGIQKNESLRIIYPNGRIEYCDTPGFWYRFNGCTSRNTQERAIKAAIDYDDFWHKSFEDTPDMIPFFIGYL